MKTSPERAAFFYLAPIRGITDAAFRRIFHHHFPYFNAAVAPFLNPQRFIPFKERFLADVLPENNPSLPVVPQLLYNTSDDFVHMAKQLEKMGYTHINWNLGCPAPQVANKKRGSGFLPHSERILLLLDTVIPAIQGELSIKCRLGYHTAEDLPRLLPLLEQYPLKEIIIHPRIGKQLYKGNVDLKGLAGCLPLTSHTIVYNGDINSVSDFHRISARFPQIDRWMIGRGTLANPFLLAEIQGINIPAEQRREILRSFHDDIYCDIQQRLSGPGHMLSRMKQIWNYLIESFPESEKLRKKIQKTSSLTTYRSLTDELFEKTSISGR